MPCGSIHQGKAGQSFHVQVTGGPTTVEGLLTSSNSTAKAAGTTTRFTDAQLRAGQTVPLSAGYSYHLTLRRSKPQSGSNSVQFTAPSGNVTNCSGQGPAIGTWIVFA